VQPSSRCAPRRRSCGAEVGGPARLGAISARLALSSAAVAHAEVVLGHPTALPVGDEVYGCPPRFPHALVRTPTVPRRRPLRETVADLLAEATVFEPACVLAAALQSSPGPERAHEALTGVGVAGW
jgi:hypothetical protein